MTYVVGLVLIAKTFLYVVNGISIIFFSIPPGEIAIEIKLDALKIMAPREAPKDHSINSSLMDGPGVNMGLEDIEEDEEEVAPRSCWCFCFRKSKSRSTSSKRRGDKVSSNGKKYVDSQTGDRDVSNERGVGKKDTNVKPHRSKHKDKKRNKEDPGFNSKDSRVPVSSVPDVVFSADRDVSRSSASAPGGPNGTASTPARSKPAPVVMEFDQQMQLVKLRDGHEELASPTRSQSGPVGMMCEQWKSDGRFFIHKARQLCEKIVEDFHTDIVKYFEQERSTLILDVVAEESSVVVFNICMKKEQVTRLEDEVRSGKLLTRMHEMFLSKVDLTQWDIRGTRFNIDLNEEHVTTCMSELS